MSQTTVHIEQTDEFTDWLAHLKDSRARAAILGRIRRCANGNTGITRSVGSSIFEMKIDYGPGYRLYYVQRGQRLILLLCGGDKRTQQKDIERAKFIAKQTAA